MKRETRIRPYDVKTHSDILRLSADNYPRGSEVWSIVVMEDYISLHPPRGESFFIKIPHRQFNALVDWYMTEQPPADTEGK